jgi:hypothetical protein
MNMGIISKILHPTLKAGQRIVLSGGYDMEPKWLGGHNQRYAEVIKSIPGQNKESALLVKFDKQFEIEGYSAIYAVLELRYEKSKWEAGAICHIEACDFLPEEKTWKDRKQGEWVESNATLRLDIK